ncbi:MAG: lysylphosphatidylglycerol synthase transmembrane domain-containing protein [Pseudomonadota bacterium]
MKKTLARIKQIAPWIVALAIFVYLFHVYPPSKVWEALKYVNIPVFTAFSIFYFGFIFLVDSWSMKKVITKFSHAVRLRDIFAARGATYLVMVLNYPASQAAFAYYLKRRYNIAIFEALGIFLFIVVIDLVWIITLALAGSLFQDYSVGGMDLGHMVQTVALVAYSIMFVWLMFWRRWLDKLVGKHIRVPMLERFRKRRVFHIFDQAKVLDYIKVALMRTPIHLTIIISMYVVLLTFHTHIPFTKILGNVPLVFLVGTLPITPGGLGTTNALMVELLYPYLTGSIFGNGKVTPQELLFTATLLWMFANYFLKVIVGGSIFVKISKDLFKPTKDVPEENAEHEAAHVGGNI